MIYGEYANSDINICLCCGSEIYQNQKSKMMKQLQKLHSSKVAGNPTEEVVS